MPRVPKLDQHWRRNIAEVHLVTIAKRNGIRIEWVKGRDWMEQAGAYEAAKQVDIPHPHTARQYLVALHELGHLLGVLRSTGRGDSQYDTTPGAWIYLNEASAWAWAIEHIHSDLEHLCRARDYDRVIGQSMSTHAWTLAWNAEGRE